jgi:hypothetical protein
MDEKIIKLDTWQVELTGQDRIRLRHQSGTVWESDLPLLGAGAWAVNYNWVFSGFAGTRQGGICHYKILNGKLRISYRWEQCRISFTVEIAEINGCLKVSIPESSIKEDMPEQYRLAWVDILPGLGALPRGANGYLFLPCHHGILHYFNETRRKLPAPDICDSLSLLGYNARSGFCPGENYEFHTKLFGSDHASETWQGQVPMRYLGVVSGKTALKVTVEHGQYDASLRFAADRGSNRLIWGDFKFHFRYAFSEPLIKAKRSLSYQVLTGRNADWQGLARSHREFLFREENVSTLKTRIRQSPGLADVLKFGQLRILFGCRTPSIKGDGKMNVRMTYRECGKLIRSLHEKGIKKCHVIFCGFNNGGHDGMYPTIFPIETAFGTKRDWEYLLDSVKEIGWTCGFHAQHTDAFIKSTDFNSKCILHKTEQIPLNGGIWAGGLSYIMVPGKGLELAQRDFPKLKKMGLTGFPYIDVVAAGLREGFVDGKIYRREKYATDLKFYFEYVRKLFGGVSSEYGIEPFLGTVDFVLHAPFGEYRLESLKESSLYQAGYLHEFVPAWHILSHGIMAYDLYPCDTADEAKMEECIGWARRFGAIPTLRCESGMPSEEEQLRLVKLWGIIANELGPTQTKLIDHFDKDGPVY